MNRYEVGHVINERFVHDADLDLVKFKSVALCCTISSLRKHPFLSKIDNRRTRG